MTTQLDQAAEPTIATALDLITDQEVSVDNRAAAYGVLHQVQLRINRALRKVKDELVEYLVANDLKELGPLSIKATAFDVAWPCNAEDNWGDITVQDAMRDLFAKVAPEYVRHVPEHYEIRTAELGAGVAAGDPVALQLHRELKDRGWRTEEGRRLSLAVREVAIPKRSGGEAA